MVEKIVVNVRCKYCHNVYPSTIRPCYVRNKVCNNCLTNKIKNYDERKTI